MEASEPTTGVSSEAARPLKGRTVILTRPQGQQDELVAVLKGYGARVILLPTIAITAPSSWAVLDQAIDRLTDFDWLVFTSANGVRFFFQRLNERQAIFPQSGLATFAIGPATAATLRNHKVQADLVAENSRAEGALAAFIKQVGGKDKLRGLRFLIPRARRARDLLPKELARLGAQVEVAETYQTIKPDLSAEGILRLVRAQPIDAITFTSSSTVANFAALVGLSDLSQLLKGILIGCIGPVTARTARQYGLSDIVQPQTYTTSALADALADALARRKPD